MTESLTPKYKSLQIIVFILYALGPIVGNVILVLQGGIGAEFHETPAQVLIAIPAFMIPFAIVQLFSGAISDLRGRIPVIIIGLFIFGAGNAIAALAHDLSMFTLANSVTGVGFGFINPVLIALITDITPRPEIPWKVSILSGVATLGVGLGPLLGGFFITFGWQAIYVFLAVITFIVLIAISIIPRPHWKAPSGGGLKMLLAQFSVELRRPVVLLVMASAFLIAQGYLSLAIMTSTAVAGIIPPSTWGAVLLLMGVSGALAAAISGKYNTKRGPGLIFWVGGICLIVSVAILLSLGNSLGFQNLPMLTFALLIGGVSGGTLFPAITSYSQVLSPSRRGALAGLFTTSYFTGIALVPAIFTPILTMGVFPMYAAIMLASIILNTVIAVLFYAAKKEMVKTPINMTM